MRKIQDMLRLRAAGMSSRKIAASHAAGEKLYVDYAGTTLDVIDGTTREVLNAQLFVRARGVELHLREATWT